MRAWTDVAWLGFDTETTGVYPSRDRLVTAALVLRPLGARGGAGDDRASVWLADPGVPIPPAASAVNGITTARARAEGQPIERVLDAVAEALVDHLAQGFPVVAFNASFDMTLLDSELERHALGTLEERLGAGVSPLADPLVLDRALFRRRPGKRTLARLAPAYGVAVERRAHTAEVDAATTLDVLSAQARTPQALPLRDMDPMGLHAFQVEAHRRWACEFEEWLRARGRRGRIERTWPRT